METLNNALPLIALSLMSGLIAGMTIASRSKKPEPPKIAGTAIPELGAGLDISKRYDVIYSVSGGDYGTAVIERLHSVQIIGYVGSDEDAPMGKLYMRSRWLVVEFPDQRRAYLMPRAILSLTQAVETA